MTVNFLIFCTSYLQQLSICGREGKEGNMYVPLHVGVFFLLLFLKVAFACFNGMCSNFILQVFSFFFKWKKNFPGVGKSFSFSVAASRVPRREDVLQRYYENSASLLEKLRNKIWTCNIWTSSIQMLRT